MITVFVYGCSACGVNAEHVRRAKRYAQAKNVGVVIKNTRYDKEALTDHRRLLSEKFSIRDNYAAIVLEGGVVTLLKDFNK